MTSSDLSDFGEAAFNNCQGPEARGLDAISAYDKFWMSRHRAS